MADAIRIKKGLDLPITGVPEQRLEPGPLVTRVGIVGPDFVGLRPTMLVAEGDRVKLGQALFEDKRQPGVRHTSPGSGTVIAVHRGEKRAFQSIVVELSGDDEERLDLPSGAPASGLSREQVTDLLVRSGLWTALRTRPYSRVPAPLTAPHSLFVTAVDTNPLAADPRVVLAGREEEFERGLRTVATLTDGPVFLCRGPGTELPGQGIPRLRQVEFAGPHPAGLVGTHIHHLDPVGPGKAVWHLGYQDVLAIGALLATGRLSVDRVIAFGGPSVTRPRLLRTRLGAAVGELAAGGLAPGENRLVSGSVLSGRTAAGPFDFLGRFHLQVAALAEGRERVFLGWQRPGLDKYSIKRIFFSRLLPGKRFAFTTSTEGSARAMVPVGSYERVLPLDMHPTYLLRALIVQDTDKAQALGCLELDEEDLALCSFVCPGKYEYGPILRRSLELIEKEG
ncbi:MAG: Na(+)-translocating NADH-quinone reductase subunit A [Candidatus Latescibacterota bacterium]|jgi:Na+-transporting NADH:ubiquinone oxidoreductase subunit A